MKRFNPSKVRPLGNLQSKSEREKAFARRLNGIKMWLSQDKPAPAIKKVREEFLAPIKRDYIPPKPRGRSHVVMGSRARAALEARHVAREAFIASL